MKSKIPKVLSYMHKDSRDSMFQEMKKQKGKKGD